MSNQESFDTLMQRLEQIVQLLEKGECPLEDAMRYFEEGVALCNICDQRITQAKQLIEKLSDTEKVQ